VREGNIPPVMAAIRNTAIGLMRFAGFRNIAAAIRHFAAQPAKALTLIGIPLESHVYDLGSINAPSGLKVAKV